VLTPLAAIRTDLRYVWRGPSILVLDQCGRAGVHPLSGFFFRQNRYLRDLHIELFDESPYLCSLAEVTANELELAFVYPPISSGDGGGSGSGARGSQHGLLYRDLDLRVDYRVHPASLEITLRLNSRWQDDVSVDLAFVLSADYVTTDEAHFDRREQYAPVAEHALQNGVRFSYQHEQLPFATEVVASGASWTYDAGRLRTTLRLERQVPVELRCIVRALDFEDPIDAAGEHTREELLEQLQHSVWQVYAPGDPPLTEATERAASDLSAFALLEGPADEWLTPAAGVPLYLTMWGRDALTTSWQMAIMDNGAQLSAALARCARLQGSVVDPSGTKNRAASSTRRSWMHYRDSAIVFSAATTPTSPAPSCSSLRWVTTTSARVTATRSAVTGAQPNVCSIGLGNSRIVMATVTSST
jgi:N-terminal domain of (some) glycogen debranching enzymes